ncbi:MAG: ATP adenylyltransferase [Cyanobacteriota bacterium]
MRAEVFWQEALRRSDEALACGALVPLTTELLACPEFSPFVLRRLLSATPRHLKAGGPKPNPFLPWEPPLEVARLGESHLLLLNKYPVEPGHLLLITQQWQPQAGWLDSGDWAAVATVSADTDGLWFFNSSAVAGASQPHRHLQLLPRAAGEVSCPLASTYRSLLRGERCPLPWCYAISAREDRSGAGADLPGIYQRHAAQLGLGHPDRDQRPRHAYNVLFDRHWFVTIRREQEHGAGFSINGLGFAGYLLITPRSDLDWLRRHGPWSLLATVAPVAPGARA